MINKDKTVTVAEILAMLADGRVTMDMPIAVYRSHPDCLVGHVATEILTQQAVDVLHRRGGRESLERFVGC